MEENKKKSKKKKNLLKNIKQRSFTISQKNKEAIEEIEILAEQLKYNDEIQNLKEEYNKAMSKAEDIKEDLVVKLEERTEQFDEDFEISDRNDKTKKKHFTILGYKPWKLMAYFVLYSFLGFILETTYGLLTKGVIESRKSFLYGPFCGIYGLGAIIMLLSLQYFKKNNYTLFFGGYVIGSLIEYFVSLFGEMMLHVK